MAVEGRWPLLAVSHKAPEIHSNRAISYCSNRPIMLMKVAYCTIPGNWYISVTSWAFIPGKYTWLLQIIKDTDTRILYFQSVERRGCFFTCWKSLESMTFWYVCSKIVSVDHCIMPKLTSLKIVLLSSAGLLTSNKHFKD